MTIWTRVYYFKLTSNWLQIEEKNMPHIAYFRRPHPQLTTKWSVCLFINVPLLNPHWLAFEPRVCLLPWADRPQYWLKWNPIVLSIVFIIFYKATLSPKITSRGSHEYSYFTHFYKATLSPLICAPPSHISVTLTAFVINYFLVRPKTLGLTHFFIFWKSISLFLVLWKINVYKYWFEINIYTIKYLNF